MTSKNSLSDTNVIIDHIDNKVFYQGPVTELSIKKLINIMENNSSAELFIDSGGGSSEAGMIAGSYISKNNVAVIVVGRCYSSCANYIFLPSKNRMKIAGAKIGLHGGAQSYELRRKVLLENLPTEHREIYRGVIANESKNLQLEIQLLKDSGVNPEIIIRSANETLFGEVNFNIQEKSKGFAINYKLEKKNMSEYELWFPSVKDYHKWGISIKKFEVENLPENFKPYLIDKKEIDNIKISKKGG